MSDDRERLMSGAVAKLVALLIEVPDGAQPLELSSFELVQLAEALEEKFGFVVAARELRAENFGSVERIVAYVAHKQASR